MWSLLLSAALASPPSVGVQWAPFSRADLVFVAEGRASGVLVGEYDGLVSPGLEPFIGWQVGERLFAALGGGAARLTTTTWAGDQWQQRHWGVIRPTAELRGMVSDDPALGLWLAAGLHGDIPSARVTSSSFTAEEQALADEDAWLTRARLGGIGGHLGAGASRGLAPGLSLGIRTDLEYHRGFLRTSEAQLVSSLIGTQTALMLTFHAAKRDGDTTR